MTRGYELDCKTHSDEWETVHQEYDTLDQEREKLQESIRSMVEKCNVVVCKQNELMQRMDELKEMEQEAEIEKARAAESSTKCLSVINAYNEFMEKNKKQIKEINAKFDGLWTEFEKRWMQWKADDIIMWFRYKTVDMDTGDVDWETTNEQLKKRKITGKSLQKFNDLTFEFLEIHDFEVVQYLLESIQTLNNGETAWKHDVKSRDIAPRYICPLTKKVMMDPVIAFDGHCYERAAIEHYLKQHNKSPVTGKDAEYLIVFPNHRLRSEIAKDLGDDVDDGDNQDNDIEGDLHTETF